MIIDDAAHPSESEEGENYFVSMTDMMVGVLFIFIIMLMVFALDYRTKTDVQEDAVEVAREVARKLKELRAQVSDEITSLDEAQRKRRQLLKDIETQLRAQGLNVQVDEANGVLRLTEDAVRFDASSSALLDRALLNVGKIAKVLDHVLPDYTACRLLEKKTVCREGLGATVETVFIEGHTDVTGIDDINWQLSTERAVNTYREIVSGAPQLRQLRNQRQEEIISVSGYSSTRPIDQANNRDAWSKNRRIDLRFVMEIDSKQRLKQILDLTDEMQRQIDRLTAASGGVQ